MPILDSLTLEVTSQSGVATPSPSSTKPRTQFVKNHLTAAEVATRIRTCQRGLAAGKPDRDCVGRIAGVA